MSIGTPFAGRRFVIFNNERGIYLGKFNGKHCWSLNSPGPKRSAPTFESQMSATEYITSSFSQRGESAPEYELKEVQPSLVGAYASIEDCANALLPRWEPEKPVSEDAGKSDS